MHGAYYVIKPVIFQVTFIKGIKYGIIHLEAQLNINAAPVFGFLQKHGVDVILGFMGRHCDAGTQFLRDRRVVGKPELPHPLFNGRKDVIIKCAPGVAAQCRVVVVVYHCFQ